MANLRVLSLVAVAALLLAPAASAQTPAKPTAALTAYAVAPASATIPLGGQATFNITVSVTFTQVICSTSGTTVLAMAMDSRGLAGVEGTLPASIELTVPANIPTPPATTPTPSTTTVATGTGVFLVKVYPSASPNHDHIFQLNATYTAGVPSNCSASAADTMDPTQIQTKEVAIKTGPGSGNQTTTGPTTGTGPTGPTTTQASPLADVPFVALTVLGVALVASRRRFA